VSPTSTPFAPKKSTPSKANVDGGSDVGCHHLATIHQLSLTPSRTPSSHSRPADPFITTTAYRPITRSQYTSNRSVRLCNSTCSARDLSLFAPRSHKTFTHLATRPATHQGYPWEKDSGKYIQEEIGSTVGLPHRHHPPHYNPL
jgi:hypothetical protein